MEARAAVGLLGRDRLEGRPLSGSGEQRAPAPRLLVGLFAAALVVLVLEPGRVRFFEPDESRYAEIPREMLASGDLVVPRLNGVLYFEKPPLHYWAVAASMALFGEHEWAARLPSKASAAGMALAAFLFARRRWGGRVGALAGLVTASSLLVVALGRVNTIDPSLSFALALAAFAFVGFAEAEREGNARRSRRALLGLHVACAAAVMLKGLIGLALPGGAILVWVALTGRWRLVPRLFSPVPLLVFLALTVPWHVLVARREPDFLQFYFVHEHLERFTKPGHRREGHPLFFVGVLAGGLLPWTVFFGRLSSTWPGLKLSAWRERAAEAFLWVFSLLVFAFFSVSRSKLVPYVLPIWPALSVLLALGIERARARGASFRPERRLLALLGGLAFAGAVVLGWGGGLVAALGIGQPAYVLAAGLLALFLANLLLGEGVVRPRGPDRSVDPVPAAAIPWLLFLLGAALALPAVSRQVTPWPLVEALLAELRPGDVLLQRGHYLQAVPFYTKRLTPIGDPGWSELQFGSEHAGGAGLFPDDDAFWELWNGPRRVFVVAQQDRVRHFGFSPPNTTEVHVLGRTRNGKSFLLSNRPPAGPSPRPIPADPPPPAR